MIDYNEYRHMKDSGFNIDAAINESGLARAGILLNYSSKVTSRFINSISQNLTYNRGGDYNSHDPDAWESSVRDKPDPLVSTLLPIHLLINSFFTPGADQLDAKKANLK